MNTKTLRRSFAAGEIAPELYGRIDLTKFQTGVAKALNFWILPHGPAQNRPGFTFTNEVKDSTKRVRLIPFSYSTTQTYILEFGPGYIRFHTNGATLLEAAQNITGITQANPGVITIVGHGFTTGQWVYLTGIGGMTQLNGRYVKVTVLTANTFSIQDMAGANINTTAYGAWTAGGTAARVYEIVSTYAEADLFDVHYAQSADVLTIVHPSYPPAELKRLGATNWTLTNISFTPSISPGAAPTLSTIGPGGGAPVNNVYCYTALASETLEESYASATSTQAYDLTVAGNAIDADPPAVVGAQRYNIYKQKSGLFGYIGQTDGSALRDNNITPDMSKTPPEQNTPFVGAGNYPGAVGYFDGRRVFAGTDNKPQNFWCTRSDTESNLSYSIPSKDDDAIIARIVAREVNRLRHIVPLSVLFMLTSGGEWKIQPQGSDVLTPSSASAKQDVAEGASNVQPLLVSRAVIYTEENSARVRELKYQQDQNGNSSYYSNDISIMATHLFDDYGIVDMAYIKRPHKMAWMVRNDGVMLGLTYLPEHEIAAWHEHSCSGAYESCAAVKEAAEYPLYVLTQRTINGRSVRYIERLHKRSFTTQSDAFFVDCGASYSGVPITTISNGLWHLEGQTVSILADGNVHAQKVVTGGTVTLDHSASTIQIGLPITADLQTLPLILEAAPAAGQGTTKNVSDVWLRVISSKGIKAGPSFDKLREYKQRTNEAYDEATRLVTGEIHLVIDPKWNQSGGVCIRNTDPVPQTIASMTLGLAVGG